MIYGEQLIHKWFCGLLLLYGNDPHSHVFEVFCNLSANASQADDGGSLTKQLIGIGQPFPNMCLLIFPCLDETAAGREHCSENVFRHGDAVNSA